MNPHVAGASIRSGVLLAMLLYFVVTLRQGTRFTTTSLVKYTDWAHSKEC